MNPLYLGIGAFLISAVTGLFGYRKQRESGILSKYTVFDTIDDLAENLPVGIKGTVVAKTPLQTPFTHKPCVYYKYILEREEPVKQANGSTIYEWRLESAPPPQFIPFSLQNGTGSILVQPDDCEVNGILSTEQYLTPGAISSALNAPDSVRILASAITMMGNIAGNRERMQESAILVGSQLNVFGFVSKQGNEKVMARNGQYPLVLSLKSKRQLVESEMKYAYLLYAIATILAVVGILSVI